VIVAKFGGTSVGDAAAIERLAGIVRDRIDRQPIVVVSAMSGTTNALLAMAEQSARGQLIGAMRAVEGVRERHLAEAEAMLGKEGAETCDELSVMCDELAQLVGALNVLGDLTPRSLDAVAAFGERLSSVLVTAVLRRHGVDAQHVDARDIVITSGEFTRAEPLPDEIAERARERVLPIVNDGRVPVLGGYIGATKAGITTTLGRGGSDYSAALVGAALRSDAIEIWTDVDGMLTADPRVVEGARLIERIRFDEASELASFGAKVLHPMTIAPAVRLGIPVYIYNSRNPSGTGTLITADAPRRPVSAIAGKGDVTMVKVRAPRMLLAHGFLRTVFEIFERNRTSVDVVATSEVSVSLTTDEDHRLEEIVVELRQLGDVAVERNRGIVALVGAGLSDSTGAMARALAAFGDVRLHMLSLSATGINLTAIVDAEQVNPVMQRLHAAFFPPGEAS
jgi:aspartate kinase